MSEPIQSLADLQAEYQEKITKALGNAKTKLKTELELAAMTLESIVKAGEAGIWQSPTIAPILKSLGLQPAGGTEVGNGRTGKKRGRKPGVKVAAKGKSALTPTEQKIFDYLAKGGKKNAEINKHFKMANSSVNTSKMKAKGVILKKDGKWFPK